MILRALFLTSLFALTPVHAEKVGPWDLDALKSKVPEMHWVKQEGPIHSLIYQGENYQGHKTEVFAYYASPITLGKAKAGSKFPGMVLIHGGGGTAFAKWVWLWAQRGYCAIAMDLGGYETKDLGFDAKTGMPNLIEKVLPEMKKRLANPGPEQGGQQKFDSIGGSTDDDWPFHAVASVMRAHTLLRSFPEVEAEHTGVTGISWGGYTTCLVASLDDRFKAAVPVYGCGFLFEGESVQKPSIDKLKERRDEWIKLYDPSSVLPRCRVPILFVNGTNDIHYPLDSFQKSADAVPANKHMRAQVNMSHGHSPGWAPKEIGLFIDSYCRGGAALPQMGKPVIKEGKVVLPVTSAVSLKSARLHYTIDGGLRSKRTWKTVEAKIEGQTITAPQPPKEANTWFMDVTDERDAIVSTMVQFQP